MPENGAWARPLDTAIVMVLPCGFYPRRARCGSVLQLAIARFSWPAALFANWDWCKSPRSYLRRRPPRVDISQALAMNVRLSSLPALQLRCSMELKITLWLCFYPRRATCWSVCSPPNAPDWWFRFWFGRGVFDSEPGVDVHQPRSPERLKTSHTLPHGGDGRAGGWIRTSVPRKRWLGKICSRC